MPAAPTDITTNNATPNQSYSISSGVTATETPVTVSSESTAFFATFPSSKRIALVGTDNIHILFAIQYGLSNYFLSYSQCRGIHKFIIFLHNIPNGAYQLHDSV